MEEKSITHFRKKYLFIYFLFPVIFIAISLQGAENTLEAFLIPENVVVNEAAFLVLRTQGKKPDIKKLPVIKNLRWISNSVRTSSQVNIVNGKMSSTYENHIPFIVTEKGTYTIPLDSFVAGKGKNTPGNLTFKAEAPLVRSAGERNKMAESSSGKTGGKSETVKIEDAIFSDMVIPGKKKEYFTGEEIPLEVNLYILNGLSGRPLAYPEIKFGSNNGAIFRDYSKVNGENPNFERVTRSRQKVGGRIYSCLTFHTRFTPVSPGEMKITSLLPSLLLVPDNGRRRSGRGMGGFFDDEDFFGSFFPSERRLERNLHGETFILVKPRPALPEKTAFFTGLTGNWKGEVTLSPPPYKVGEPINLTVRYTGNGSLDFFKAPVLTMEKFRIYPPEVEKGNSFAEAKYILIPSSVMDGKEENLVLPPLAVFDPGTGKYDLLRFSRRLIVEKGSSLLPEQKKSTVLEGKTLLQKESWREEKEELEKRETANDVLYLKKTDGKTVVLPLWKNHFSGILFFVLSGILFLILSHCIAFIVRRHARDPFYARKKEASRTRKELLSVLARLAPDELASHSGKIAEVLAALSGLAPGADLKECAEKIHEEDPVFASMLEKMADAAWMPDSKKGLDENFKKTFLKKFTSFSILFLSIFLFVFCFTTSVEANAQEKVATAHDAAKAYDAGAFAKAEEYYRTQLKKGRYSGEILYDLGNTLYRMERYPEALVSYERAIRLAPRDPDILENLNLVRRKLFLPEKGKVNSPGDIFPVMRDHLRPDEWLLAASAGFFLLCIAFGLLAFCNTSSLFFRSFAVVGCVILLCSLCAFFSQQKSSYSGRDAIIIAENVKVYSLPSDKSTILSLKLRQGEEVFIAEKRQDFYRIRSGNAEGWVKFRDVQSVQEDAEKKRTFL